MMVFQAVLELWCKYSKCWYFPLPSIGNDEAEPQELHRLKHLLDHDSCKDLVAAQSAKALNNKRLQFLRYSFHKTDKDMPAHKMWSLLVCKHMRVMQWHAARPWGRSTSHLSSIPTAARWMTGRRAQWRCECVLLHSASSDSVLRYGLESATQWTTFIPCSPVRMTLKKPLLQSQKIRSLYKL